MTVEPLLVLAPAEVRGLLHYTVNQSCPWCDVGRLVFEVRGGRLVRAHCSEGCISREEEADGTPVRLPQ